MSCSNLSIRLLYQYGTLRKLRQSHNKANWQEENELYNHDHKKFETTILHNDHFNDLDVADGGGVGSGPDDRCDCSDRIPSHITIVDNNNIKTASTTIIIVVVFIVIGRGIYVKNSFS